MKHDKTNRDLESKDINMPGGSSSSDQQSDRLRRSNLEESEVGASSGSQSENVGSGRSDSSSSSSGSRSGSSSGHRDVRR